MVGLMENLTHSLERLSECLLMLFCSACNVDNMTSDLRARQTQQLIKRPLTKPGQQHHGTNLFFSLLLFWSSSCWAQLR